MQVCRVSGNLPVAGCKNAASISRLGEMTYKSMVYTEYFARGTEPQRTWSVHATQALPYPEPYFTVSSFDTMGEALNMEPRPEPPSNRGRNHRPPRIPHQRCRHRKRRSLRRRLRKNHRRSGDQEIRSLFTLYVTSRRSRPPGLLASCSHPDVSLVP